MTSKTRARITATAIAVAAGLATTNAHAGMFNDPPSKACYMISYTDGTGQIAFETTIQNETHKNGPTFDEIMKLINRDATSLHITTSVTPLAISRIGCSDH